MNSMPNELGRPPRALTLEVIQRGPMATSKAKWAAVAKYKTINADRVLRGLPEITATKFCEWTGISESDVANAESKKEYVEAALSISKGGSVLGFRNELPRMMAAAKKLYEDGKEKEYLQIMMNMAEMFNFKHLTYDGMEDAEPKNNEETVKEIMSLMNDDAVRRAMTNEDGLIAQKLIPALINAPFKPGTKQQILTPSQLDNQPKADSPDGPDKSVAPVQEAGDRPLQ